MKEFKQALLVFVVFTIGTGLLYPFVVAGIARLAFQDKANGSVIFKNGRAVGSELIGQKFVSAKYFHGRPSSNDYDAANSGGSNFGLSNEKFQQEVAARVRGVRAENGLAPNVQIPADLVLSSASGLDPDISLESALLQARRVAKARGLSENRVTDVVRDMQERRYGQGPARVNVLKLNIAMDDLRTNKGG
jgi:potassium-transporting ATPase KdpC subunit